ncbi:MAG: hypothetical protein J6X78_13540 [Treponema sp.]|nr:hypothetical protein [Treponema sp.]
MAAINELINQIQDEELKRRIEQELDKITKQKKFGLVFEEHLPECVPLYDVKIRRGAKVALKTGNINETYTVTAIEGENIYCTDKDEKQFFNFIKSEVVCVAEFGEPIYPYLQPVDAIYNSDDTELPTHTLIQADNYHALQLLEYLYAEKVDCIYIDPPYNTGARDWKYNNDYVDSSDTYRHSKWLSMMKKRLLLAKKLLNPADSVMIVTIDEKEYLHLGCLLEELFPEARIQMVSVAIHASGVARAEFSRTDEYYFFVFMGESSPSAIALGEEWSEDGVKRQSDVRWESLLRSGNNGRRVDRPNLFYPVFFDKETHNFAGVGEPVPLNISAEDYEPPEGKVAVLPRASDDSEACWRISANRLLELREIGAFDWGEYKSERTALKYLKEGELSKIGKGEYKVTGKKENGAMIISAEDYKPRWLPGTQWHVSTHQAGGLGGSGLIKQIFAKRQFEFPKSLYAVHDTIRFFVANKPNALIVDFFAGSGTTLHAVNLLNAEDGGKRQCVMVTNNEVSDEESKQLRAKGFNPGDAEWEKLGIANYVTWPRTVCSIKGKDINGNPLKGNYIGSDIPMADGFKSNAAFFKLSFLDKTAVALGRQFKEMLPTLWLKAGAWGKCPSDASCHAELVSASLPPYIILAKNRFAVLIDENIFSEFEVQVHEHPEIQTVYLITDFEKGFKAMSQSLKVKKTYQLYRDYLDNFRINVERN